MNTFNKLDKLNYNYNSLKIYYENENSINYLEQIKIDFNKIKKISFEHVGDNTFDYNIFLNKLFQSFNIQYNLIYLYISLDYSDNKNKIDNNIIENLNNFKSLECLKIFRFKIKNPFLLKLYNLKNLDLYGCENIGFYENSLLTLKNIRIGKSLLPNTNYLIELPLVEKCILDDNKGIDFNSLKQLKSLISNGAILSKINYSPLEYIKINSSSNGNEKEIIEKLITIKTLKEIYLEIKNNEIDKIAQVEGKNDSVKIIDIFGLGYKHDCAFNNLFNKFPNLSKINLHISNNDYLNKELNLEIKEDTKSKINNISLNLSHIKNCKLYCSSYCNLIELNLIIYIDKIINLKESFPLFNDECNICFKSLNTLSIKLSTKSLDLDILKTIYNNLDKMPKLKNLRLDLLIKDVEEKFYKEFIRKILKMRLDKIDCNVFNLGIGEKPDYTKNELKEIFPDIKFYDYQNITSLALFKIALH